MHKITTVALIALIFAIQPIARGQGQDRELLFRMAGQGCSLSRKDIVPLTDGGELLRIAQHGNPKLQRLAKLIIARDLAVKSKEYVEEQFGEDLKGMQSVVGDAILNSSARQSLGKFLGDDLSVLDEVRDIADDMGNAGVRAIASRAKQYDIARHGWVLEGLICDEVHHMLVAESDVDATVDDKSISVRSVGYKSGEAPFAAFNVTNRTDATFKWAVVILRVDCEFEFSADSKLSTAFGQTMGRSLFGNVIPDFVSRQISQEQYGNLDKCTMFFVRDWEPRKIVRIVSIPAAEYCSTAIGVTVDIICPNGQATAAIAMDRHKKYLRDKYAPKPTRRRR